MRSFSGSQSMWKISAVGEGRVLCGILGTGRQNCLAERSKDHGPRYVAIQDQDEVCLLNELVFRLSKRYSRVGKVVEGDVDCRHARTEDRYRNEVN